METLTEIKTGYIISKGAKDVMHTLYHQGKISDKFIMILCHTLEDSLIKFDEYLKTLDTDLSKTSYELDIATEGKKRAKPHIVKFGKYKGQTIEEIAGKDIKYIWWMYYNSRDEMKKLSERHYLYTWHAKNKNLAKDLLIKKGLFREFN